MPEFKHIPVMLNECLEGLKLKKTGVYVDGTLGGAGHSLHIAKACKKLIAIDRDQEAIKASKDRLKQFKNVVFVHDNFFNIKDILVSKKINEVDGILLDLGVSSYQLDNTKRGFSYSQSASLDMRMDQSQILDATYIVNHYSLADLTRIIREYGEEKFAFQIAKNIIKAREKAQIQTSDELKTIIEQSIPAKLRFKFGPPYKRTFQALRIEVNSELDNLGKALLDAFDCLKKGGRLVVITFHSLEDRIAKQTFANLIEGCICKEYSPICICGKTPRGKLVNKKPIVATEQEIKENSRSTSAKLRIIEKL